MNSIYEQLNIDIIAPIPLYYQIKIFMIKHIEDNRLKEGELISLEELCIFKWQLGKLFRISKGLIDEDLEQNSLYNTLKIKYNIEIAHINR